MVPMDSLHQIRLFAGLSPEALELLAQRLNRRCFAAGQTILRQGEPTHAIYFILSGTVRVELTDPGGLRHTLATLGAGEMFGERALLTGELRTADVRSETQLQAAELPAEDFAALLPLCPELYANLCRQLARQLGNWAVRHHQDERENREILSNLVGWQLLPEFEAFPGTSPWAQQLNRDLGELAESPSHLLILGEIGTWKDLAARLVHFHSGEAGRPVLYLDCADPPPVLREQGRERSAAKPSLELQIAQESALFGHQPDSAIYARGTRRGYLELADGGDLILRNVGHLAPGVQKLLLAYLATGSFTRRGETTARHSRVRMLATSDEDLPTLAGLGHFDPELCARLAETTVRLKPLRERKKDIPVIARQLLGPLNKKHHKQIGRISQDALNLLVDYDWPLNGTELQQVMDRAVAVCTGPEIQAEQIFLQGVGRTGSGKHNLLRLPAADRLARSPLFPGLLRYLSVPTFLLALWHCLAGPAQPNLANLLVWSLWWPVLILSVALGARSWCSYCPVEALSESLSGWRRRYWDPPRWLRRSGGWLAMAGFIAVLLAEQATQMFHQARATGLLLAALLAGTVLTHQLFGPRVWCKYLCPLGRMIASFARISLVEMHSNGNVCTNRCKISDCIKEKKCPMGLHPTAVNSSDDCILCFSCVKNCPHHAVRLDLRDPALGVLQGTRRTLPGAAFAATLVGLVLASRLAGPSGGGPWGWHQALGFLGITLGFVAAVFLASSGTRARRWQAGFAILGYAYLPLALTGMFNLYFRHFVSQGPELLRLAADTLGLGPWLPRELLRLELGTLQYLLPLLTLLGAGFSFRLLGQLAHSYALGRISIRLHQVLMALTAVAFLVLL
ncbi:histidine kinase [Desulfuromonas versatilis]|uniref:Histidine kinase n=1 Tax=Desulfuromonas versatilis TaxID=2802975 RepID=A0ABM8HXU7_9BACT|nr:sigma 54-interacting transcriptional regulator [Desulfuromonas versatilis]BCR06791.1 histidine kinase [Desulfuromonas versatilis]